jgi:hypothetical protein
VVGMGLGIDFSTNLDILLRWERNFLSGLTSPTNAESSPSESSERGRSEVACKGKWLHHSPRQRSFHPQLNTFSLAISIVKTVQGRRTASTPPASRTGEHPVSMAARSSRFQTAPRESGLALCRRIVGSLLGSDTASGGRGIGWMALVGSPSIPSESESENRIDGQRCDGN